MFNEELNNLDRFSMSVTHGRDFNGLDANEVYYEDLDYHPEFKRDCLNGVHGALARRWASGEDDRVLFNEALMSNYANHSSGGEMYAKKRSEIAKFKEEQYRKNALRKIEDDKRKARRHNRLLTESTLMAQEYRRGLGLSEVEIINGVQGGDFMTGYEVHYGEKWEDSCGSSTHRSSSG